LALNLRSIRMAASVGGSLWQLGDVHRNAPRLAGGEQVRVSVVRHRNLIRFAALRSCRGRRAWTEVRRTVTSPLSVSVLRIKKCDRGKLPQPPATQGLGGEYCSAEARFLYSGVDCGNVTLITRSATPRLL
jgi:hypothetical protein